MGNLMNCLMLNLSLGQKSATRHHGNGVNHSGRVIS